MIYILLEFILKYYLNSVTQFSETIIWVNRKAPKRTKFSTPREKLHFNRYSYKKNLYIGKSD